MIEAQAKSQQRKIRKSQNPFRRIQHERKPFTGLLWLDYPPYHLYPYHTLVKMLKRNQEGIRRKISNLSMVHSIFLLNFQIHNHKTSHQRTPKNHKNPTPTPRPTSPSPLSNIEGEKKEKRKPQSLKKYLSRTPALCNISRKPRTDTPARAPPLSFS